MEKPLLFCLSFLVSLSWCHAQKELTILYTNDIESVYEPIDAFWDDDLERIGGLPYLATLIKQTREAAPVSFLFDAGDIFTGALSAATKGRLPFDIYSSIGYDAIALGNHEFEYGWEDLLYVKQRSRFPVLNCNIFYESTDINLCQSYTIVEQEGVRIGLIGLMGEEAFKNTMNPAHRIGLEVRDPYPIAQQIIDDIHKEVDLIVLLTHQNLSSPMQTDKEADPEVQRGFDEDYAMAGKLKNVDLIIGGHSDNGLWEPVVHPETGTIVCLTFGQGKYLGYLNLVINENKVEIKEGKLIPVDAGKLKPDKEVLGLVRQVRVDHPELMEVLGTLDQAAYRKYYRESSLGNLLTDMLKDFSKADIGMLNSGALRADLNSGEITTEEMINIYPFVGQFNVVEIDGRALKDLLEYSYELTYGFAQLSGLTSTYDAKKPVGKRLIEARVNGSPIIDNKKYTLACSNFLANGGDGFTMLKEGQQIYQSDERLIDYLIEYIRTKKQITLPILGRQINVSD